MNTINNQKHTRKGIEMVRKLYEEGKRIFTVQEAHNAGHSVGMADSYVVESLHHLSNNNWIVRLKRGLYAISSSFPGATPIHEFEIAMALIQPSAISHWSALHYHGLTEQIPGIVYVATTKPISTTRLVKVKKKSVRSSSREISGVSYMFVTIKPERFFGTKTYWIGESRIIMTDPERTLIDGLMSPKYFGDWAEIYSAFESHKSKINLEKIIAYALRLDAVVAKRLGWILERTGVSDSLLEKLKDVPIRGFRVLDPGGPRRGPCIRKWMIQENLPGMVNR